MSAAPASRSDLDDAVAAIYGGPPDEFVSRRAALSKELRAAGRRDDAAAIKRLRKPKRLAWALDAAVLDDPETIERVDAAVKDTLAVQSTGGDIRAAFSRLRLSVNQLANAAVQAGAPYGLAIEHADLVQAVLAVIGVSDAFDALHTGRLVDVPAAGSLDFLTIAAAPVVPSEPAAPAQGAAPDATAARAAVRRTDDVLAAARGRAGAAERALREAKAKLEAAEEQMHRAQRELETKNVAFQHAQRQADLAATELSDAEREAAHARSNLEALR